MHLQRLLLQLCSLAATYAQTVTLVHLTAADAPTLSSTCLAVLNQAVACDPSFTNATKVGLNNIWWYSDAWLSTVCTTTCQAGLANWLRRINGACGTERIVGTGGALLLPSWYAEYYVELWSESCLKNGNGSGFCNAEARGLAAVDPDDQQVTGVPAPSYVCSSCFLSIVATRLEMPLASNTDQYAQWSMLTSACGATNYSLMTPASTDWILPPSTAVSSTASATPTCVGSTYTIQPGDTCQSVATSQGIDTVQLLVANGLAAFCQDFPTSGSLCIPATQTCTVHTVQANDTCFTLASIAGDDTTWTQILSWNPELGFGCGGIGSYVGYQVCVSVPGGRKNPVTTSASASFVSSAPANTYNWTPFSAFGSLPTTTTNTSRISASSSGIPVATIAPLANNTREDCFHYEQPPILTDLMAGNVTSACDDVAAAFNITTDDLIAWNPSLNTSAAAGNCTLDKNYRYCVVAYESSENATDTCDSYALPSPGFTCEQFANSYGVDLDQFVLWNPSVGTKCANFVRSRSYCVFVHGFRQAGAISICNLWAIAEDLQWIDQPCQILETQYGLSHARFVAWNPALQDNCTGMYLGYEYCVSIPNYRPTYTTPTTPAAAATSMVVAGLRQTASVSSRTTASATDEPLNVKTSSRLVSTTASSASVHQKTADISVGKRN